MRQYLFTLVELIVLSVPNILTALMILIFSLYFARVFGNLLDDIGVRD